VRNPLYLCLIGASVALANLQAQPAPKITSLSREWLQRGVTTEVLISGDNLRDVESVHLSGDAGIEFVLTRPDVKQPRVQLESSSGGISVGTGAASSQIRAQAVVAADASLNSREFRVITASGISNPVRIQVSGLPEFLQAQNGGKPQTLTLPAGVSGVISAPEEQHSFQITARKGEN
jgi:hypothetical protein